MSCIDWRRAKALRRRVRVTSRPFCFTPATSGCQGKNYDSSWTLDIKLCFFLFAESTFSSRCRRREPAHITALPKRSCSCGSGLALPEYTVPVMRFAAHSSMTLCLCKAFEDESDDAVTYLVWSVSPSFGTYWGIATSTYAIVQSQPFAMPGDNTAS